MALPTDPGRREGPAEAREGQCRRRGRGMRGESARRPCLYGSYAGTLGGNVLVWEPGCPKTSARLCARVQDFRATSLPCHAGQDVETRHPLFFGARKISIAETRGNI